MAIIEHGTWDYYTPQQAKESFPAQALYARRDQDGVDWYDFQKTKPFTDRAVVMTVYKNADGQDWIGAATFDYTAIFPPRARLIEETEYTGSDPQVDFGNRVYNADTRRIGDKLPPVPSPQEQIAALLKRIEALEQK